VSAKKPLVLGADGRPQQLQAGDSVIAADPTVGSFAPGAFSLAAGQYALMTKRLVLTGSQRVTLAGDSRLRIDG